MYTIRPTANWTIPKANTTASWSFTLPTTSSWVFSLPTTPTWSFSFPTNSSWTFTFPTHNNWSFNFPTNSNWTFTFPTTSNWSFNFPTIPNWSTQTLEIVPTTIEKEQVAVPEDPFFITESPSTLLESTKPIQSNKIPCLVIKRTIIKDTPVPIQPPTCLPTPQSFHTKIRSKRIPPIVNVRSLK